MRWFVMRMGFKGVGALVLAAAAAISGEAEAQEGLGEAEREVYAVVEAMFDAMREKDADGLAELFAEGARLNTTSVAPDGTPRFGSVPIPDFVEAIRGSEAYLDEQIWDPEVLISDRLATVWVKYALYVDEAFSHCGVDAYQLFNGEDGWKIFQLTDTRRRADCWEPPA